ncbi:hypothetical protein AArcCO_0851 [Halalkaliarchaeum sp. AArc-CO]|uniref:hypothetical protein n=1 Tax=Halalkaliarchaeum sp. AArc-CO TaxID=2866381 RepID=UPI00217E4522|nr:hypothetical protein [Halalkaliarchaeum sp. AArc-CO]UWG50169.1 hypothetical protein AArcCO_0851 [Halalkaliarchaeum sp. AArc-CO]
MRRRKILQMLAAGVVSLSGCTGTPPSEISGDQRKASPNQPIQESQTPAVMDDRRDEKLVEDDFEFDRVVDAVDDLGMDATGEEPIDDALADGVETGTLIEFPPGDYTVAQEAPTNPPYNPSRFGMVGRGESHTDVQFHFPNASEKKGFWFFYQAGGKDILLKNFSIQLTDDRETSVSVRFDCNDGGLIEDVEWLGFIPAQSKGYGQLIRCNVAETTGANIHGVNKLRRLTIGRGGAWYGGHRSRTGTSPGTTYIRHYPDHIGEVIYEDLHLEQSGGNAFRSTNNEGVITVRGGLFRNNDISNLRLQGGKHPTKISSVTGARVVINHDDIRYPTKGSKPRHGTGIHIDSRKGESGVVFEDCDIEYYNIDLDERHEGPPNGVIRLSDTGVSNPGGFTMKNCRVYNNTTAQTFWLQSIKAGAEEPHGVTLENVDVTATAETQYQGAVIAVQTGRNNTRITNCCIHAPNSAVDGIAFENCNDVIVRNSNINVGGLPVRFTNSNGTVRNISNRSSCTVPNNVESQN